MRAKEWFPPQKDSYRELPYVNYDDIVFHFGHDVLLDIHDHDYQGDSRYLLHSVEGSYGYLIFGWGSCSGCDALQACETYPELDQLIDSLESSILWFASKQEALEFFSNRDWETKYEWHANETKEFVKQAIELLKD